MKNINNYIIEKLHLDKDIKANNTEVISADDSNAKEYAEELTKEIHKITDSYSVVVGDSGDGNHFYIRPSNDLGLSKSMKEKSMYSMILDNLAKYVGHLYIVAGKISAIDRTSRINNLKRTYWMFYLGEHGEIFNDKKEATKRLKEARNDIDKLGGSNRTFKVMTIKEASDIEASIYGNKKEEIRFKL